MKEEFPRQDDTLPHENKTSTTVARSTPSVTAVESPRAGLCGYVIAPGAKHFCNRPASAGRSYCAWHRAASPPALGWLNAPPEFFDESEDERLAGLDLPAPAITHDE